MTVVFIICCDRGQGYSTKYCFVKISKAKLWFMLSKNEYKHFVWIYFIPNYFYFNFRRNVISLDDKTKMNIYSNTFYLTFFKTLFRDYIQSAISRLNIYLLVIYLLLFHWTVWPKYQHCKTPCTCESRKQFRWLKLSLNEHRRGDDRREGWEWRGVNRNEWLCSHHWLVSHSPPSAARSLDWQPALCRSDWLPFRPKGSKAHSESASPVETISEPWQHY